MMIGDAGSSKGISTQGDRVAMSINISQVQQVKMVMLVCWLK